MSKLIDSRTKGPDDALRSYEQDETSRGEPKWTMEDDEMFASLTLDSKPDHGKVDADYVEGLPRQLVMLYADIAVRHAAVREIEDGTWFATVVGLDGAWGDGDNPEEATAELHAAIVGWIAVKRRVGARDIPSMEGVDLNPPTGKDDHGGAPEGDETP